MKKVCLCLVGMGLLVLMAGIFVSPSVIWASSSVGVNPLVHSRRHVAMSVISVTEERQKLYAEYFNKLKLKRDILAAEGMQVQELDLKLQATEAVFAESQLAISQILERLGSEYDADTVSTVSLRAAVSELRLIFSTMYESVKAVFEEISTIS